PQPIHLPVGDLNLCLEGGLFVRRFGRPNCRCNARICSTSATLWSWRDMSENAIGYFLPE
ncbi:MAG: hypothetical protein C4310_12785, partial [Chloroflexota bacterium]